MQQPGQREYLTKSKRGAASGQLRLTQKIMNILEIIRLILTSELQTVVVMDNDDMTPTEAVIYLTDQKLALWSYEKEGNSLLIYKTR